MRILVTGACGKVGRTFIDAVFADPQRADAHIVALCHNRVLPESDRLTVVKGSISDRNVVEKAMQDVTHVVHLATCKEIPEDVMDVAVKGLFWLLETARLSESFQRFVLIGGDAGMGHFVYPHPQPVVESQTWSPIQAATLYPKYSGMYARTILYAIRLRWLLSSGAMDYGEGRFPLQPILWR